MKKVVFITTFLYLNACFMPQDQNNPSSEERPCNALIHENSPYLLQHAHNPVNWMPWNEETLKKAKQENKPLLISIGYSACHWCHVMEHENFEDTAVAQLMNEHFINIKVDREERPDIDQVYMNAVQLMTGRGGWPLNCFATPDGRPFYGGTYFPKENWIRILEQLSELYKTNPHKVEEYANKLTEGVKQSELIEKAQQEQELSSAFFEEGLTRWKSVFDPEFGGNNQAPKFPIPSNYSFLMHYAFYYQKDPAIQEHLLLSLEKMAYGGIFDQVGGGFSRYSTDKEWKVPHFEKMLYDNAQLIALYSEAYRVTQNDLYKKVVAQTVQFIREDLSAANGAFYSALDADSEGEEGKFYVWTKKELQDLLGNDFPFAEKLYNINSFGLWEKENYVLIRTQSEAELAMELGLSQEVIQEKINDLNNKLKKHRSTRVKPGLDDKTLTSWNALTIKGLVEAYFSFGDKDYLNLAQKNAQFLIQHQLKGDGGLWHSYKNGKSRINGYLEDYSFTIEAFIALYEASLEEQWLENAEKLARYCFSHFSDESSKMFYFTSDKDPQLIARKVEVSDNVIPSSNSSLARSLFRLGKYFDKQEYIQRSKQMLQNMLPYFNDYLPSYSNWAIALLEQQHPFYEVAVVGPLALEKVKQIQKHFYPNKLILGSAIKDYSLSLLENKWRDEETTIYVCENKVCKQPENDPQQALSQLAL
jgi:uncharacterized protein YyaL (SSP411 family)